MKNVIQKIQVLGAGLLISAVLCACGSSQQGSTSDPAGSSLASSSSMGSSGQAQPESSMPSSAAPAASSSVGSSQPAKEVDVEALKAIAEKDTFEIKVVKKEFQKNAFSDFSADGKNSLLLQYKNVSDSDLEIKELNTAVVLYDQDNHLIEYYTVANVITAFNASSDILSLQANDLFLQAGETKDINFRNRLEEIGGAQVLVYSYVTADGTEHSNELLEEWMKAAIKGNNQVLE